MALDNPRAGDLYSPVLERAEALLAEIRPLPASADPHDAITLLISTRMQPVNKSAWIDDRGLPQKRAALFQSEYLAVKVPVAGHAELQRVLRVAGQYAWVTFLPGILADTAFFEPHLVFSSKRLNGDPSDWHEVPNSALKAIGRVSAAFVSGNWRPFDRDRLPADVKPDLLDPKAWWKAMGEAIPVLGAVRATIVPSTTGRILLEETGEPAFGQGEGLHAWVRMENSPRQQADLVALKQLMQALTTLAGLGRKERTEGGGTRYDGIWDPCTFSTERPCFDGAPDVRRGLVLAPPSVTEINSNGPDVDVSRLTPLSEPQKEKVRKAREGVARKAARGAGLKRHSVDRRGHITLGRGPRWMRLLNGLGATPACRDVLIAVALAAANKGVSQEILMAEIDRRIAYPSRLLLRDDSLVLNKLRDYRDDPEELERIVDWAWNVTDRDLQDTRMPAWQQRVDRRKLADAVYLLEREMPAWPLRMRPVTFA